jgi:hypothetical protein
VGKVDAGFVIDETTATKGQLVMVGSEVDPESDRW